MVRRRRRQLPMVPSGVSSFMPFNRQGYPNQPYQRESNQFPEQPQQPQQQGWNNAPGGYQPPPGRAPQPAGRPPPPYPGKEGDIEQSAFTATQPGGFSPPPGPPPAAHVNDKVSFLGFLVYLYHNVIIFH